jgi:DNA-directed RNA polymerase II subunit RPB2
MSFRWDVINSHARDVSLTQQAIHSFDDFIARSIPEIIAKNNKIEVRSQLVESGPKRVVKFSNPIYKMPSVVEKNQDVRPLTPYEARIRDLTFSAPMYVDVSYKETPTSKPDIHKQVYIGRMPVMVNSAMDIHDAPYSECEHDPGGYMIINGNEKVVIVQQRVIPNVVLCFQHNNTYQSIVHSCSNKWTNAYCALKINGNSLIPARVDSSGFTGSIPVITFLTALGWNMKTIKQKLNLNEEEWDLWYKDASLTVKDAMKNVLNKIKNKKNPEGMFLYLVYPHLGMDNSLTTRKELAMEQTLMLIKTFRKMRKCDSRDHLINKRLDTAGAMMTSLFAMVWGKYIEEIQKLIQKCCDKNKKVRIEKIISTSTITDGLKYALATGNWKSKDVTSGRVGVAQALSRNTFISCISQLRRVDSNVEAEQKIISPRKLYGDVWGFLCPNETPEGSPTGLVYQMSITAQISTESHNERLFSTTSFDETAPIVVYHNGIPIGRVWDSKKVCNDIKLLRRNRLIALDVSVTFIHDAIHIWSDCGRIYRPVFVVENGKLNITNDILDDLKKGRTLFNDLYQLGIVENIDSFETTNAYIALTPEDITNEHTHCELHPSMIFGTLLSCSPFADMNPGPRNTYQAAMGKQAMGIYISTYLKRFDTSGLILDYVQKPLATTKASRNLKQNEMPAGFNAIVACMCDEGYNQEDSTQWNKASIERGMGRSTTYQTVTASTVTRGSGYHKFKRPKHNETKSMRDVKLYAGLDDDGLPPPGTTIKAGMVAIGRTTVPKADLIHKLDPSMANLIKARDASIFHKKSSGVVDDTIVFQNDQGGQTAKVKIRVQKIPELGDKFSSRHAQKGTIGMIYQQQDLPFTQDGITPDIIINPHCMPSRMTVGHFTEQLASKVAAITGRQVDATSFAHAPVETFCKELKAAGFQPYGNEQLYSGRTGLPLKAKVFIGPLYYQKLKHMSSDKLHARPRGKIVGLTRQPNEGRVNGGGLRWGEMERDVGISYGASNVLNERMLISSDLYEAPVCDTCGLIGVQRKTTGKLFVCSGCSGEIKSVKMPYVSKLLMQELMSMGIAPRLKTEEVKESI